MALQSWVSAYLMHGLEVFSLRDVSDYLFFPVQAYKKNIMFLLVEIQELTEMLKSEFN